MEVRVEDTQRIQVLTNEHDLLRHQHGEKERYFNIETSNYQVKIQDQEKGIQGVRQELEEMSRLYERKCSEVDDLNGLVQELRIEIEEYMEEITSLESQVNVNHDAKWLTKIQMLDNEIEELKLKLKDSQIDVRQYIDDNENISKIVDQKSNQIYQLQEQINEMDNSNNNNKMQLIESRKGTQDLQQINVTMKKELLKARQDYEDSNE